MADKMWKNIFLSLLTIGTILHRLTSLPIDCAKLVQKCPVEKDQWTQKNNLLKCAANYGYVCLRNSDGYLFETCMANFPVQANSGNCPILYACKNGKSYLGPDFAYYTCPEEVSGCPPKNHPKYSIHQLYKFPRCIESNFSTENGITSPTSTKSISMATRSDAYVNRDENVHVVIIIVTNAFLFAVIGCIISYAVYSRKKKHGYSTVTYRENKDIPKDGCPYFTKVNGRIKIQQKACKGNKYGCPEAIKDEKFLLSDAYMFPSCLPISVETTKTKVSSTKISTNYKFVEVNDSRTTQTRFDSGTTNGNTATVRGLLLTKSVFVLGVGLFVLISAFTGYVAFQLYKRITDLRERLEADHCMSSNSYRDSTTQRYEESENEAVYDYVHDEDETSMSNSESIYAEGHLCCYCPEKPE